MLEGLHFLLSPDARVSLQNTAWRRGEVVRVDSEPHGNGRHEYPTLQHHFCDHKLTVGASFAIDGGVRRRRVNVVPAGELDRPQFSEPLNDLGVRILDAEYPQLNDAFGISVRGAFPSTRFASVDAETQEKLPRVSLQIGEVFGAELRGMWDALNAERQEAQVTEALHIIDKNITDLYFETALAHESNARIGARFGHRHRKDRLPIGILGDGIMRLLGIGASLAYCRGGTLLVDEIDTGLHWSIMGDLWKLVIESAAADQNDAQVFATTHSFDCLRGLASACANNAELADAVSVQKIDAVLDEAVALAGERLPFIMEQQIEVR